MKHPLSGVHLEGHCSTELGEHHPFTVNMNRVNIGFWVGLVFFSQECSLGKEMLLSKAQGQHKTFSRLKILNYLPSIRQAAVLHLASCFIVWQHSWLEAEIENHFPLLNFLVNSKRMVLICQTSLGKCIVNMQDLSSVVLKRGMWFDSCRDKSGHLQLWLHLVFAVIDFHCSMPHQPWITKNTKARERKNGLMLWNHLAELSELL